jgi:DNA polymerase elongation subunit (family B)
VQDAVQLQEPPYLIHPVENNTVGLYKEPVCVLDFASLYPSLFRAYNLSYDTLLCNKEDVQLLGADAVFTTPTGLSCSTRCEHPHIRRLMQRIQPRAEQVVRLTEFHNTLLGGLSAIVIL